MYVSVFVGACAFAMVVSLTGASAFRGCAVFPAGLRVVAVVEWFLLALVVLLVGELASELSESRVERACMVVFAAAASASASVFSSLAQVVSFLCFRRVVIRFARLLAQ